MAKNKLKKQVIVRDLQERIGKAKSMVIASFNGFGVKANEQLRSELRKEGGEYLAAKKTLLTMALKDKGLEADVKNFAGQIAVIFGYEDEVAPAKIVAKFIKDNKDQLAFVGGFLDNKFIDQAGVTALAKLPSKDQLRGQLVGTINAPISGFVNVMAGNLKGLVRVLSAISEKK